MSKLGHTARRTRNRKRKIARQLDRERKRKLRHQFVDEEHETDMETTHIIAAIHGVRRGTGGNWEHDLQMRMRKLDPSVLTVPFFYNRIPAIKGFGLAFLRKIGLKRFFDADVDNFAIFLQKIKAQNENVPISIVAHSNGTYITLEALERMHIKVNNVILVQPVISRRIDKTNIRKLFKEGLINRLTVWSSKNDKVVGKLVRFLTFGGRLPGYGMSGYSGMVDKGHDLSLPPLEQPYPDLKLFNTVTDEPHGGVLDNLERYLPSIYAQAKAS